MDYVRTICLGCSVDTALTIEAQVTGWNPSADTFQLVGKSLFKVCSRIPIFCDLQRILITQLLGLWGFTQLSYTLFKIIFHTVSHIDFF